MPYEYSDVELADIPRAVSMPRFATYMRAATGTPRHALALYQWNAETSAAFLFPLHVCEVVLRNAAAEAIAAVHSPMWPWTRGFVRSLPNPSLGYSPQRDVQRLAAALPTTGKIVAELPFFFWQKLFTVRNDARIWNAHLRLALPHLPPEKSVVAGRQLVHDHCDHIRTLRNRVAHHEPIFARHLLQDYERITDVVSWRCPTTAAWLDRGQQVLGMLAARPDLR